MVNKLTFRSGALLFLLLIVLGALEMNLLVASRFIRSDCYGPVEGEEHFVNKLEGLVRAYEKGELRRDMFQKALLDFPDFSVPVRLDCDFSRTTLLKPRAEPYRITNNISVRSGAILVLQPGVEIILSGNARLTVSGRLFSMGTQDAPVRMHAVAPEWYGEIRLKDGPNDIVWTEFDRGHTLLYVDHYGKKRTNVEHSRFDNWRDLAVNQRSYDLLHLTRSYLNIPAKPVATEIGIGGLHISRSEFGLKSPRPGTPEVIRVRWTDSLTIENSEFGKVSGYNDIIDLQDCMKDSWPLIRGNFFHGGEDDAIDLDECSAFVVGNVISGFKPNVPNGKSHSGNGGGITGAGLNSKPVIINNIITNNLHGIGFKDGARPVIVNNTIINNGVGVTLYQSKVGKPKPHGILINNILWDNSSSKSAGARPDILLNGKWWPKYNQEDDIQASLDARYNIVMRMPKHIKGESNLSANPHVKFIKGIPTPQMGSSAIGSGLGQVSIDGVPTERLRKFLSIDFLKAARKVEGAKIVSIDRGAVEAKQDTSVNGALGH